MDRLAQFTGMVIVLLLTQLMPVNALANCNCPNGMVVFGTYETATLENIQQLQVAALVDSGATTTALDARNIKLYVNRQGRRWVYYDFHHKPTGKTVSMHQPVSRVARVITHSGRPTERAVVMNTVSIGRTNKFLEMSLINRSNFPQQLLIGRNYLTSTALIDSGRSYLQSRKR